MTGLFNRKYLFDRVDIEKVRFKGTKVLINRICNKIRNANIQVEDETLEVAMTFGVATYQGNEDIDSLIKRADDALYEGKNNGRNCVVYYSSDGIIIENN